MSRVLVYRSVARYDALGCFADRLVAALRGMGHEVDLVPYTGQDLVERLTTAFSQKPEAVIGFNGVGVELETVSDRLYSRLGVPYLAIIVDHPIYLYERLATAFDRHLATFVDHTHVDFARRFIPNVKPSFLAHAAYTSDTPAAATVPRDLELLFTGSYEDPEALAQQWRAFKPQTADLFEDVATRCLETPSTGLYQHFEAAFTERGLPAEVMTRIDILKLLHLPDRYVRAHWRTECLRAFEEAGLAIDVYGHNWQACPLRGSTRHRFHEAVGFDELLPLLKRARIALAVGANFPTGSHERVLTSMAAGAATISDHTRFYAETFTVGRDLVTYRQGQFAALAETVRDLRADPARLAALQEAGPRAIGTTHSWTGRAREVAALLGLSGGL